MTEKTLDQFMRDFFRKGDTIEVDCNWLQEQLRNRAASNGRLEHELRNAQYQIETLQSRVMCMEMDMPQYKLNVKG